MSSAREPESAAGRPAPRTVLMNPGPVNTDERVRAALGGPDLCHREPEFSDLMARVRAKAAAVAGGGAEHTCVVLTGSGTAAVEAIVASVVPEDGGLLVLDNGHYGHRFSDIASAYGIAFEELSFGWGNPIDIASVESALAAAPHLTHVAVVHHETSTGMLNPVAAVAHLSHRLGREVIVDAISSVGAEDLDIGRDAVDWLAGSSNKCIEGMPGLGFVCARTGSFEALHALPRRGYYLDLHRHFTAQTKVSAPAFTPAVPVFYAFDVALDLMLREGVAARHRRYLGLAEQLRTGLAALGLRFLLDPADRAVTLTAVELPDGVPYARLHAELKAAGFVIYTAQEQLAARYFRLSTMGQMTAAEVERFLTALGGVLGRGAHRTAGAPA